MNPSYKAVVIGAFAGVAGANAHVASAAATNPGEAAEQVVPGLVMPSMDPVRGKQLFASKGCVVCHSINGVGGTDAPRLDAATMPSPMNPFEFFAKMWRGAMPMVMMQMHELGHQIEFNGQELADIVAFAHNPTVQKTFSTADIPPSIKKLMARDGADESSKGKAVDRGMMRGPDVMPGTPSDPMDDKSVKGRQGE